MGRSDFGAITGVLAAVICCSSCVYDFDHPWLDDTSIADIQRPPDGTVPPDSAVDAAKPDLPKIAPKLCWEIVEESDQAVCPPGWVAIAGASACEVGIKRSSFDEERWRTACLDRPSLATAVLCADSEAPFRRVSDAGYGDSVRPVCEGDDVTLGGGCLCDEGTSLLQHAPTVDREGWTCICNGLGDHIGFAVCTDTTTAELIGRSLQYSDGPFDDQEATIRCSAGTAISGGCGSNNAPLLESFPNDPPGWYCGFGSPPAAGSFIRVICATSPVPFCP